MWLGVRLTPPSHRKITLVKKPQEIKKSSVVVAVEAGTRLQQQFDDDDVLKSIFSTELCLFSTTTCFGCLQEPKLVVVLSKGPIYYTCTVVFVG